MVNKQISKYIVNTKKMLLIICIAFFKVPHSHNIGSIRISSIGSNSVSSNMWDYLVNHYPWQGIKSLNVLLSTNYEVLFSVLHHSKKTKVKKKKHFHKKSLHELILRFYFKIVTFSKLSFSITHIYNVKKIISNWYSAYYYSFFVFFLNNTWRKKDNL